MTMQNYKTNVNSQEPLGDCQVSLEGTHFRSSIYSAYLTANQFFHDSFQTAGKSNEKHFPNEVRKIIFYLPKISKHLLLSTYM